MKMMDKEVKLLTGKCKGKIGTIQYQAPLHHLSSTRRFAIRVFNGSRNITVLINEDNFEVV